MSESVYAGLTSQTIDVFLQDSSSSVGAGLAGLLFNTAGLVASYRKGATGTRTAITLATQTVGGAWSSGGFAEIDATHMKGTYRFDLVNAMVDTEGFVTVYFYGATNLLATAIRIDCRAVPANVLKINSNQTAAARLARSASVIAACTASGAPSSTSIDTSACDPAASASIADQFKGRVIIFDYDTSTVALRGQATLIEASSASATPTFTVTALSTTPFSGDTFIIV